MLSHSKRFLVSLTLRDSCYLSVRYSCYLTVRYFCYFSQLEIPVIFHSERFMLSHSKRYLLTCTTRCGVVNFLISGTIMSVQWNRPKSIIRIVNIQCFPISRSHSTHFEAFVRKLLENRPVPLIIDKKNILFWLNYFLCKKKD